MCKALSLLPRKTFLSVQHTPVCTSPPGTQLQVTDCLMFIAARGHTPSTVRHLSDRLLELRELELWLREGEVKVQGPAQDWAVRQWG